MSIESFMTKYGTYIIPPIAAAIGFIIKDLWERVRDRGKNVNLDNIITKLEEKKFVNSRQKKRLKNEAIHAIEVWKTEAQPVRKVENIDQYKFDKRCICIRGSWDDAQITACPESTEDHINTLFIQLKTASQLNLSSKKNVENLENVIKEVKVELQNKISNMYGQVGIPYKLVKVALPDPRDYRLRIWISISYIIIDSPNVIKSLMEECSKVVFEWFNPVQVVLEAYVPFQIYKNINVSIVYEPSNNENWEAAIESEFYSLSYTSSRNQATSLITEGVKLGTLQLQESNTAHTPLINKSTPPIPKDLLNSRLPSKFFYYLKSINNSETAAEDYKIQSSIKAITIKGPPGSGKTELASIVVEKLVKDINAIAIVAVSAQVLEVLSRCSQFSSRNEFLDEIIDAIRNSPQETELIPSHFKKDVWCKAFCDALLYDLKAKSNPMFIVVDDVQAYEKVGKEITKIINNYSSWQIRFIVVGRDVPIFGEEEEILEIECDLWSRSEAVKILKSWKSCTSDEKLDQIMTSNWVRNYTSFSLYILGIIHRQMQVIMDLPSVILRREMDATLSKSLDNVIIDDDTVNPKILLEEIKQRLTTDDSKEVILDFLNQKKDDIDPVLLFGLISWYSRYDERDSILKAENVSQWTSKFNIGKHGAEILLQNGVRDLIFSGGLGLYKWRDLLTADACAALYLDYEINSKGTSSSLITEMVTKLDASKSTDFLPLVLTPRISDPEYPEVVKPAIPRPRYPV